MKILTFDTSLDKTYVTLSEDDVLLNDLIIENKEEKYHSAFLIPTIVDILKSNNLVMQDIDVIGTNVGPGSFTGIRACVSVARVIAQQLNCPLVGVSSLEILSKINKGSSKAVVVLDARKNQYYTAIYENRLELQAPKLTNADDVKCISYLDSVVISDKTSNEFLKSFGVDSVVYTDINADLGQFLNQIVYKKINSSDNDLFLWGKLKPLYLQAPPVTIKPNIPTT